LVNSSWNPFITDKTVIKDITAKIRPTIETPEIKETKPFFLLDRKYLLEI
jgi:hypothetical protein